MKEELKYLIKFPQGYKSGDKYPVIIWLHGAGSREADINILKTTSPLYRYCENKKDFGFITIYPHCVHNSWFDIYNDLIDFIINISKLPFTDISRIYLCGVSMGGYTAYQVLMTLPNTFSAAVICCGGGMYWNAERIETPLHIFHGNNDAVVYPSESVNMYSALKNNNKKVRLTLLDNVAHNCWDYAFSRDETYSFLLKNILK